MARLDLYFLSIKQIGCNPAPISIPIEPKGGIAMQVIGVAWSTRDVYIATLYLIGLVAAAVGFLCWLWRSRPVERKVGEGNPGDAELIDDHALPLSEVPLSEVPRQVFVLDQATSQTSPLIEAACAALSKE
jgi:hypothetical protein